MNPGDEVIDALPVDRFPIVDSHLDLAENVTLFGRDLTLSVSEIRAREGRRANQATVSLPELERGGIAVVLATVTAGFRAEDVKGRTDLDHAIYFTPEQAQGQALRQIALYDNWEREGRVRIVESRRDLHDHLNLWHDDRRPGLVLLMEGADPIVRVSDLPDWWRRGLRAIGLTFGDTRYGAGVRGGSKDFKRGGLTPEGLSLLNAMVEQGFIWDISHLTDEGIEQGLELDFPRVCASHATARALKPTDRHLTDDVIRALGERDGMIGLVLYNSFLEPRWIDDKNIAVTLDDQVRRHAAYIANLCGWIHLGIGSDLDGGFGREESPIEIETVADLHKVGNVLPREAARSVLGANWIDFLERCLPASG